MISLGAFELFEPAGRGGMGEVWRGRHRAQDVPVAVKVLTVEAARDPAFLASFRTEARAVAGLDHPSVLLVFDHGAIPPSAERQSDGRLVAGSPFLVMEWASGGPLSAHPLPASWAGLRRVLLVVLDALAHAHARGVVHRDLKLGNLLVCNEGDLRPGLKLADFGIARLGAGDRDGAPWGGTVTTMAPEQIRGSWRDQGPWTDLYGLGCVAYKLVTGRVPFAGESNEDTLLAHLCAPLPEPVPRIPAPEGVADWLAGLLEKDPAARFRTAADAAAELVRLGEPQPGGPTQTAAESAPSFATLTELDRPTLAGASSPTSAATISLARCVDAPVGGDARSRRRRAVATIPTSWRRPESGPPSMRLVGTGLGLYGLRTVPLVDREDERQLLWHTMVEVGETGSARVVLLEGAAGCGKSRLAGWLCERALEVGAASTLRAEHDANAAPTCGLASMLARQLRCEGLVRAEALTRIQQTLPAEGGDDVAEWLLLAELVAPATREELAEGARPVHLGGTRARHELVRRQLGRLSGDRPLLVWLDDVQWAIDSLKFVQLLLDSQDRFPIPVLVVMTCREDLLVDRPAESEALAEILRRPGTSRIQIGPLPAVHAAALVRELLGLEGELAAAVEARTAGNPLFAVQLVGDWVQRGLLEPGERGFRLRPGARVELPDDLDEVWAERLAGVLGDRPDAACLALELAAVLGQTVSVAEWADACDRAAVAVPWDLVEDLFDRRLATEDGPGRRRAWAFVHGMLRESLLRRARRLGRLSDHHAVCAMTLRVRGGAGSAERLGRHLLAAGTIEPAIEPLFAGARERRTAGELHLAALVLSEREQALRALSLGPADERWGAGWALAAEIEIERGHMDDAERWARAAEHAARRNDWKQVLAASLLALAKIAIWGGDQQSAEAQCSEALELFREAQDARGVSECLHRLATTASDRGDVTRALDLGTRALALYEQIGDEEGLARCTHMLGGHVYRRLGDHERFARMTRRAQELYEKLGMRHGVAHARMSLGEMARFDGRFDEAEEHYRAALAISEAIGSGSGMIAHLNLGLTLLGRGRIAEARSFLEEGSAQIARSGWRGFAAYAHVALLVCDAEAADWAAWDLHLGSALPLIDKAALVDPDLGWAAALAGERAALAGESTRARAVYELAREQWRALGRDDELARVEELLSALRPSRS